MMRLPIRSRLLLARSPVALALALAGGCASLDPKPDIERAASTVGERSGVTPTWTEPWEASLTSWDAREPLKVEQALAMALRNNREIRAEVELIAASRADLVQAGLLPNPVVGLTLRFPFDPVSGGTFVGAQVVQSFTALWLREGKIRAADARLNQTVLGVSDKALALVAAVKASHTRIAFGQRAVALADQNLATIQKSINSLDARVRGGEGTTLDVNRARQQLAKAEAERVVVMRELVKERRRMLELVGFAAENADWAFHCHKVHHLMNGMGHNLPQLLGVNQAGPAARLTRRIPGYMPMPASMTGMMEMGRPPNTIGSAAEGPFDEIDAGGMFTLVKVRAALEDGKDPGWYAHPPGTVAAPVEG